jgi:hypothetical protein
MNDQKNKSYVIWNNKGGVGKSTPKTVVGYITDYLEKITIDLNKYITRCFDLNQNISKNVYLLSGDGNLELIAPLLA